MVVDDHPIFRQGLARLIEGESDLTVCGEAETAQAAMKLAAECRPDLVIIDISLKGMNGIELLKSLRSRFPGMLALILSMHDEMLYAERALRAGARGYIMKQEATGHVMEAIRRVLAGEIYCTPAFSSRMINRIIDGPQGVEESPVDVVFRDVVSDVAAHVSIVAWQIWLCVVGAALLVRCGVARRADTAAT